MAADDPRDREIAELEQELAKLRAKNAELRELVEQLRAELNKNSLNCIDCGTRLPKADMLDEPERFQQIDLPPRVRRCSDVLKSRQTGLQDV